MVSRKLYNLYRGTQQMLKYSRGLLTIRHLVSTTGVPKQTIHYYLRKGVLPPPIRTSKTSALYPPAMVELLKIAKTCQDDRRLTLDEISALFVAASYDPARIRQQLRQADGTSTRWMPLEEALRGTGSEPNRKWIDELIHEGLLDVQRQQGKVMVPVGSAELIDSLREGTSLGMTLDHMKAFNKLVQGNVQQEIRHFQLLLGTLPLRHDAYPKAARLLACLERFGSYRRHMLLHQKFMQGAEDAMYRFVGPNRKHVFPSETFLEAMGLNREIDRLMRKVANNPADIKLLEDLARAYQLRSDWVRTYEVSQDLLRLVPGHVVAEGHIGQALSYLGRAEEAVTFLEEAVRRSGHPLLKLRLAQALLLAARQTGDAARFLDAQLSNIRLTNEAIRESANKPSLARKIRVINALDAMSLADPHGLEPPSVDELEALRAELTSIKERGLPLLSRISLAMARMFVTYSVYLVREKQGHPSASKLRAEIIAADPDGILAARSSKPAAKKKKPR